MFRRLQQEDLEIVYELERKIFPDPWSRYSFEYEIENTSASYPCVIIENNSIIGYAVIWFFSNEIHIGNFAIHPEFRGKGFGIKLLTHILEKFESYKAAYLEVRQSNHAAINLYKKFKFKELYVRDAYYSDGEDAVVMEKKLTG